MSKKVPTQKTEHAYISIARGMRRQISTGKYLPGARMPSTEDLAVQWETSYFTIHKALKVLVKEGWVQRLNGDGTYVTEFKNRFICAGIYYGNDIWSYQESIFTRNVHLSLLRRLKALGKTVQVFFDLRETSQRDSVLPSLAEAIQHRQIQCLIAPIVQAPDLPALRQLSLPTAFLARPHSTNYVSFDDRGFIREAIACLKKQGCQSVGLISNVTDDDGPEVLSDNYYSSFREMVREAGLTTRDSWIRRPARSISQVEDYGYQEFCRLWKLREKPDGLIVFPDTGVRGVITAALQLKLRVPEDCTFVFHRNVQTHLLCPFPVTWALTDEDAVAEGLIKHIARQFGDEKLSPLVIPYVFRSHAPKQI